MPLLAGAPFLKLLGEVLNCNNKKGFKSKCKNLTTAYKVALNMLGLNVEGIYVGFIRGYEMEWKENGTALEGLGFRGSTPNNAESNGK